MTSHKNSFQLAVAIITIVLLGFQSTGFSQTTIFSEAFSSATMPTNFNTTSAIGGPWEIGNFTTNPPDYSNKVDDHTGNNGYYTWMDFSNQDSNVVLTAPSIDVSTFQIFRLEFYVFSSYPAFSQYTNKLFLEVNNGSMWLVLDSIKQNDTAWVKHSYDLSSYKLANDSVEFRFRAEQGDYHNYFYYDILIDDIKLYEPIANNLQLAQIYSPDTLAFTNPSMPITLEISNVGSEDQDSIPILFSFDNGVSYISEVITDTAKAQDKLLYTLTTQPNMSASAVWNCIAIVKNPGDIVAINDSAFKTIETGVPMNGIYSLGNASGNDFSTFGELTERLRKFGVTGPVIVNVDAGTYLEQITFDSTPGASLTNTITIKGKGSQTVLSDPVVQSNSVPIILFNETQYYILDSLHIQQTHANSSQNCIRLDISKAITIRNCDLTISSINAYSDIAIWMRGGSQYTLINNEFNGGTYAVKTTGFPHSTYLDSIQILNNRFHNQERTALELPYCNHLSVNTNYLYRKITGTINSSTACNIYKSKGKVQFNQNLIDYSNANFGLSIKQHNYQITNGEELQVQNNIIQIDSTSASYAYGFYLEYSNNVSVLYNSIHLKGNQNASHSLYFLDIHDLVMKNNLLTNFMGDQAISIINKGSNCIVDYNSYFSNGKNFAKLNTQDYSSLTLWQTQSLMDAHSFNENPFYTQPQVLTPISGIIEGKGNPINGVTTDYLGNIRNTNHPDMGAIEYNAVQNDLRALSFSMPRILSPDKTQDIRLKVINNGTHDLTNIQLNYSLDMGTTVISELYNDTLKANDTLMYTFVNKAPMYAMKLYTLQGSVNHSLDTFGVNDNCEHRVLVGETLQGNYSFGTDVFDNFNTFEAMKTVLDTFGISGSTEIKLDAGTYDEPIIIPDYTGSSTTNTLTILGRGDSTIVTNSATTDTYPDVFLIQGKHIAIKNMHIVKDMSTSYFTGVQLDYGSSDIEVSLCFINCGSIQPDAYGIQVAPSVASNCLFTQNRVEGGHYGISLGGSTGNSSNNEISHNICNEQIIGISINRCNQSRVTNNKIKNTIGLNYYGIQSYQCFGGLEISHNSIQCRNASDALSLSHYNNNSGSLDSALVFNNSVFNYVTFASNDGIYINYSKNVSIYHNSVCVHGNQTNAKSMYINTNNSNIRILNNILTNYSKGHAFYIHNSSSNIYHDYNDLYTTHPNFCYFQGDHSNLSAWKSATSQAAHSTSIKPEFYTSYNLHAASIPLNNLGKPISYISTDLDGKPRNQSAPDMGAYEYTPLTYDLGPDTTINYTNGRVYYHVYMFPNASLNWSNGSNLQQQTFDSTNLILGPNKIFLTVSQSGLIFSDTVIITLVNDVAIHSVNEEMNLRIYPNPSQGTVHLHIERQKEALTLQIIDLKSQLVYQEELPARAETNKTLSLQHCSKGIYLIRLSNSKTLITRKIIIQ